MQFRRFFAILFVPRVLDCAKLKGRQGLGPLRNLIPHCFVSLSFGTTFVTLTTSLSLGVENLVPYLEEKTSVNRMSNSAFRVVVVMMITSIEHWVVC